MMLGFKCNCFQSAFLKLLITWFSQLSQQVRYIHRAAYMRTLGGFATFIRELLFLWWQEKIRHILALKSVPHTCRGGTETALQSQWCLKFHILTFRFRRDPLYCFTGTRTEGAEVMSVDLWFIYDLDELVLLNKVEPSLVCGRILRRRQIQKPGCVFPRARLTEIRWPWLHHRLCLGYLGFWRF